MAFTVPTVQIAAHFQSQGIPVYFYVFNHHKALDSQYFQPWQSNYHEIELNYIFGSPFTGINTDKGAPDEFTDEERELSRRMMKLWSDFAKYG